MGARSPSRSSADVPRRQPQRFSRDDWQEVLRYVRESVGRDRLSLVAPGVSFYLMFALVPALVALVSIYGLVADPSDVQQHFTAMQGAMPEEAHALLEGQMGGIAAAQGAAGLGALIGILLAIWSSSRATLALMEGLTVVYGAEEERGFVKVMAIRVGLTLAAMLLGVFAIAVIIVFPPMLNALPLPDLVITALRVSRWLLLLLLAVFGLALLYKLGPDRRQPGVRWLSWGAAIAAVLWVMVSVLFSLYVENFGGFETYGAFAGIIILLTWLLLTAYVVLLGGEFDVAFERQMRRRHGELRRGEQ